MCNCLLTSLVRHIFTTSLDISFILYIQIIVNKKWKYMDRYFVLWFFSSTLLNNHPQTINKTFHNIYPLISTVYLKKVNFQSASSTMFIFEFLCGRELQIIFYLYNSQKCGTRADLSISCLKVLYVALYSRSLYCVYPTS